MKFRPCIDIHNGSVKQIVGGSLQDQGSKAVDNFISEQDAAFYANKYKEAGLKGGHIILLNPAGSEYYEKDLEQAKKALTAYPGGMQIGGGIHTENAKSFLDMGASHVIVTSYVFRDGKIDLKHLEELVAKDAPYRDGYMYSEDDISCALAELRFDLGKVERAIELAKDDLVNKYGLPDPDTLILDESELVASELVAEDCVGQMTLIDLLSEELPKAA